MEKEQQYMMERIEDIQKILWNIRCHHCTVFFIEYHLVSFKNMAISQTQDIIETF